MANSDHSMYKQYVAMAQAKDARTLASLFKRSSVGDVLGARFWFFTEAIRNGNPLIKDPVFLETAANYSVFEKVLQACTAGCPVQMAEWLTAAGPVLGKSTNSDNYELYTHMAKTWDLWPQDVQLGLQEGFRKMLPSWWLTNSQRIQCMLNVTEDDVPLLLKIATAVKGTTHPELEAMFPGLAAAITAWRSLYDNNSAATTREIRKLAADFVRNTATAHVVQAIEQDPELFTPEV